MKNDILDRSESYLKIFTDNFQIDRNLPKWCIITSENQESFKVSNALIPSSENNKQTISILDFVNLNRKDFNIYVGKSVIDSIKKRNIDFDTLMLSDDFQESKEQKKESLFKKLVRKFRNMQSEPVYEFDVLKFFEQVKLTTKESAKDYVERIKPYMVALKRANDMGQTALADQLTAQIFNNKYESILKAEGFYYKITEEQLVSFIKKTEKGVRLDYIKNFTRNIPDSVYEIKTKADSLLVFDNYCVLYYDPEAKSYKKTKEEEELERQKKADPILFGMINGSRNLYYISDWIDEYCDLTLEEFIKVSGYDKKDIAIDEKIKL